MRSPGRGHHPERGTPGDHGHDLVLSARGTGRRADGRRRPARSARRRFVHMTEIKRILVGIDFSSPSEKALALAIDLAGKLGAQIHLLHVYQIPAFAFPETIVPAPPETVDRLI